MRPSLCARYSSGRTEEFVEMSTRSIEMVGISASIARRKEFARAREQDCRTKSHRSLSTYPRSDRLEIEVRSCPTPLSYSNLRPRRLDTVHSIIGEAVVTVVGHDGCRLAVKRDRTLGQS